MMQRDPLIELLKRADAGAPPPRLQTDLAQSVARRLAHRRQWRVLTVAASLTAAAAVVALAIRLGPPPPLAARSGFATHAHEREQRSDAECARIRAEIARIGREASALQSVAARTRALLTRQQRSHQAPAPPSDPRAEARAQLDMAVVLAVSQAERLEATSAAVAITAYRDVIDVFPETTWAAQARRRLAALSRSQGDS
jgi:hypothetical protein